VTTILIIEDNLQNLYLMRFLLEQRGFSVLAAADGREGISAAGRLRPDCILMDIQLPGLDGYAVAAALRADPSLKAIPIIAVSSYPMVGDREKALASGATDYLEKPIDPAIFVDQIRKHVPGRS
jgi:two-component system, cell cycle response regulator DivK